MTTKDKPATTGTKHRLLLVDDHAIVREGLSQLINDQPDLTVCAQAASADEAIEALQTHHPELAVVDLSLGGKPGIELVKDIKPRFPNVQVLVLSMHDESLYAERVIRAGARGYIMKQEATEKIMTAIRQVLAGGLYVSQNIATGLLHQLASGGKKPIRSSLDLLSDRELEIFQMIGLGKSVRDIAEALHLSSKTVEAHREHIKEKMNFASSAELLRYAIQMGIDKSS